MREAREKKIRERKSRKSGNELFIEAIENFTCTGNPFFKFKAAAKKGHLESQWICDVVGDARTEEWSVKEYEILAKKFEQTECGEGWYWCSRISSIMNIRNSNEALDYLKKSYDAGYLWGKVEYARKRLLKGLSLTKDLTSSERSFFLNVLQEAAEKNNPQAIYLLGWFAADITEEQKYMEQASKLGWVRAYYRLNQIYYEEGNVLKIIRYGGTIPCDGFWDTLVGFRKDWNGVDQMWSGVNVNLLVMEIGKVMYWHHWNPYNSENGSNYLWYSVTDDDEEVQGGSRIKWRERCIDYYCDMMDLQQKSIFLFLNFWNKLTGVKDAGKCIGKKVWQARYKNPIEKFTSLKIYQSKAELKEILFI